MNKRIEKFIKEHTDSEGLIFIKATNDILFKPLFGYKGNECFLEDFLEAYYELEPGYLRGRLVINYEFYLDKDNYFSKDNRCDLWVKFDDYTIDLEMYSRFYLIDLIKSDLYIMRLFTGHAIGDKLELDGINMMGQINIIGEYKLTDKKYEGTKEINPYVSSDYVLLDKVDDMYYTNSKKRIYKYLKFFKAESYKEREEIAKGDEIFMKMNDWLKSYCNNEWYDLIRDYSFWARESGREEGYEDGMLMAAKNFFKLGIDIQTIKKATGLSKKEIEKL